MKQNGCGAGGVESESNYKMYSIGVTAGKNIITAIKPADKRLNRKIIGEAEFEKSTWQPQD